VEEVTESRAGGDLHVASTPVTRTPWASTEVESMGGGRYAATIDPSWTLATFPQGGVVAALAARAMESELGLGPAAERQQLRSIHGVFVSPVPSGSVEIDVAVLRHGRSMSQAQATVRAVGAEAGFTALAAFGRTRLGPAFTELTMPVVPPPEACRSFREPFPPDAGIEQWEPMPFWVHVLEGRPALGSPPWDPSPRTKAEVATWYRMDDQPVRSDGTLDPLTSLVMVDVMPRPSSNGSGPDRTGGSLPAST